MRRKLHQHPQLHTSPVPNFGSVFRLPTDLFVAVYYRQSTEGQVGNVMTTIQTIDMVTELKHRGWSEDKIIMIDMDAGVSGTKRIDEREGMKLLFSLISNGEIGAVACQDEDRLFRDITQIQVSIFIEACRQARVLVITPTTVYDFADEQMGKHYIRQFRFKCEMGAEYIDSYIKGRLHRAKNKLLMEGKWAGGGIPVGFMVDMRKQLPDGRSNNNWRRYTPFQPYVDVVNEYFRLFLKHDGNIRATIRHIEQHGPYYPDPEQCLPPAGFYFQTKMKRDTHGYWPGRTGLSNILTNPAYLGHWVFKDAIVRWNNHDSIVPEDIFLRAFNYLSPVGLDGNSNPNFHPNVEYRHVNREAERSIEPPLCVDMLVALRGDTWGRMGINWNPDRHTYAYVLLNNTDGAEYLWGRRSTDIDMVVSEVVRQKLLATFEQNEWSNALTTFEQQYGESKKQKHQQLTALEQVMSNLLRSLGTLTNADMVRSAERDYQHAQLEHKRLSAEIESYNADATVLRKLQHLHETIGPVLETWDALTRDEKRTIFRSFIDRIEATPKERFQVSLRIVWRDGTVDTVEVGTQRTNYSWWTQTEVCDLITLYESGASQLKIAKRFPTRKWILIQKKLNSVFSDKVAVQDVRMRMDETFFDYQEKENKTLRHHWTHQEVEQLRWLVTHNAAQIDVAKHFPSFTWHQLKNKIYHAFGAGFQNFGDHLIKRDETYYDYLRRIGEALPSDYDDGLRNDEDNENQGGSFKEMGSESKTQSQ